MSKAKEIALTGMFTALTVVLSQLAIPLPFTPVPLTLSLAAVFLSGFMLTPGQAFFSMTAYLLLGLAGAPVFAGLRGGLPVLTGSTGGFLLAYPVMAWFISFVGVRLETYGKTKSILIYVLLMTAALSVCYTTGVMWFSGVALGGFAPADIKKAFAACVLPFIPLDAVKIILTAVLAVSIKKRIGYILNS